MKKKIRIAIVGMTYNKGGIESFIMNVYRNIDRNKVQFDFLVENDYPPIAYEKEIRSMGGRIFKVLYPQKKSKKKAKELLENYFSGHPEVKGIHIHANYPYSFPLEVAKKMGIDLRIIHSHSSRFLSKRITRKLYEIIRNKLVTRIIKKNANIFLACSDKAGKAMFGYDNFQWIKNGIDLNKYKFNKVNRDRIREDYSINPDEICIGFVGRLDLAKQADFALEIFKYYNKKNQKSKMVFIGEGNQKSLLLSRVKEYGLKKNVIFTGSIYNVNEWYQAMDCLLMPSLFEGFPMTLVEAQTSGLNCLCSSNITKQVSITKLVKYESIDKEPREWSKKIEINNKNREEYYYEVKKKGFDITDVAKELEEIYCKS